MGLGKEATTKDVHLYVGGRACMLDTHGLLREYGNFPKTHAALMRLLENCT